MPFETLNPTSNTSPDPGQGGTAVSSPTNTGHGDTSAVLFQSAGTQTKSCLWTGFPSPSVTPVGNKLKVDFSRFGDIAAGGTNLFTIDYSVNGGAAWLNLHIDTDLDDGSFFVDGSAEVALLVSQDITQVRVRDKLQVTSTGGVGSLGQIRAIVSNIRIEVTFDAALQFMLSSMM